MEAGSSKHRSRGVEIAYMFEQLKEKHLAKKQEWSHEKEDLRKQLDKAHQQIRALQNLPKEIEERYKNFKKFQTQYEDLKERFDTEQLKWELDKNYLKQMVERLRSDLARNLCYLCKCPLEEDEEAYYRNKMGRNEEKLVRQLDELENEKRHLAASHRREREKWSNEKKILRDKIEKLNANIDKTYTSPLILHGSHLSSNSPYSSSINRGSSAVSSDLNFSFPGSRSSQEQGFHMLLQHIKKIDEELDDDMYETNNSQQQQQQRHAYDKQPQTSGGEVSYKTKKTTYMSSRSFDESNKQQLSGGQQQSKAAQMQGGGGYQPQAAPRMIEATSTSGRSYQSEKQILMKHDDLYHPLQQMDERMSVLSSPTTCSLPAFSDSGESETTAFTTPLPFLRKNEFDMQPMVNDFYRHQQQHHGHHQQQQERYYQAQVNKAPNYPNLNYPQMVQPVHKYYATRDSSNSPDLTFMRMQKPTTHSPRSPAQEVSSDSRSTPRQRKTLSNLHQQLLFRKSFGQGFEDSPVFQQQTKNNFLGVEGVMYNDHHLHNLPHHQQQVYQSSSKSITPQNKQHEKLATTSSVNKSMASPSNTFASSSGGSKPAYQRSNTEGIYSSVVRHHTTQQYHGVKRPHEVQLPKQKTEEAVRVGPKVPPKPKVSLDELLEVNNLTRRRDDDGFQQEEKSGNASTRGGNRMANLGKMGKQWIRKRLPFWEESGGKEPTGDGGGLFQGVENKAYMREKSGDAHLGKALNRRSVNFGAAASGTGEVKKAKRYTRSKTEVAVKGDSYSSSDEENEERSKATRNVKLRRSRTINRQNSNSNDKKKRQSIKSEVHVPLFPSASLPIDEASQNEPATSSHSSDKAKQPSGGATANKKHLAPASSKKESEKSSSSASTLKSSKKEKSKSDKETDSLVHSVVAKLNSIKENNDKTPKLEKPVKRMSSLREYLSQQRRKTDSLFAKNGSKKSSSTESSNGAGSGTKGADNKSTRESVKMREKKKSSASVGKQPETTREEKTVNRRWSVIEESGRATSGGGGGGGKRKPYRRSKTQYLNCDEEDEDEENTDTNEKKLQS